MREGQKRTRSKADGLTRQGHAQNENLMYALVLNDVCIVGYVIMTLCEYLKYYAIKKIEFGYSQ